MSLDKVRKPKRAENIGPGERDWRRWGTLGTAEHDVISAFKKAWGAKGLNMNLAGGLVASAHISSGYGCTV